MKVEPANEDSRRSPTSHATAGDLLLHPLTLASLALLIVNDHALKSAWPGLITGKLSDVGGMIFFPLFLVSAWEITLALCRRWHAPSSRGLAISAVVSVATFTLIKTSPLAAAEVGRALGLAQWLLSLPISVMSSHALSPAMTAKIVVDPSDLVALPAAVLVLATGCKRVRDAKGGATNELRPVS